MMRGPAGRLTSGVAGLVLVASLASACAGDEPTATPSVTPTPTPSTPVVEPVQLSFGAWGSPEEVRALSELVEDYNTAQDEVQVELVAWKDQAEASAAVAAGELPDVFLAARSDLWTLMSTGANQPVDELLDERDVEFGDGYQRNGLKAFSAEGSLQCMPYGNSPMVVYYNTKLVNLERMRERGLGTVEPGARWNFEQFVAAAEFGTKPRRRIRGVFVEPTLPALTPLIASAGGQVFDDDAEPASLAFSAEESREALERILALLRRPNLTPTPQQVARHGAVDLFKRGRVAMITGFRDLVPELREVSGLEFDVMPLPNLGSRTTLGNFIGVCLAADTEHTEPAADFLTEVISTDAVAAVAQAGYLVPANLEVAESEAFLQPDRHPATASVFNASVRDLMFPPLRDDWDDLLTVTAPWLQRMLNDPIIDLEELTTRIDEVSTAVLAPPVEEGEDPDDPSGVPDGPDGTAVPDVDEDDGQIAP